MKTKLHGLDHLRALAIVMVFIFHYSRLFAHPAWLAFLGDFGWTGVDLFFVLSGFLISSKLFNTLVNGNKIAISQFYIKRFFRILPTYLLIVAIYFLFMPLREYGTPAPLWKYLTFTQNIGLDLRTQKTFSHAWSLCIEEQFYLFFPLVIWLLLQFKIFKYSSILLPILFVSGIIIRWYSYQNLVLPFSASDDLVVLWYEWIYYPVWCRLDGLLVGVGIAAVAQFKPLIMVKIQSYGYVWLFLSIVVLTGAYFICAEPESFGASVAGFPLVDIGYGFLVLAAISPKCFLFKVNSRVTVMIATLSYAVYLSHKIVIHQVQSQLERVNINPDSNIAFMLCILASLLVAYAMNIIIEKPVLKFRNTLLRS